MNFFAVHTATTKMPARTMREQKMPRADDSKIGSRKPDQQVCDKLASFNELVLTHQEAAYNFATYLLGDPELAEDVTQRAFLNAYLNLHQFHGTSFRSWLFKIIKNASYDEFRRPSYRKNTSLDALEESQERWFGPDDSQDPEKAVEMKERSAMIQRALARVDENYRTVLILVDLQGFDYQEAAQTAGVPIGTIKSRLARARHQFRAAIEALNIIN